jgi:hypothetical protein
MVTPIWKQAEPNERKLAGRFPTARGRASLIKQVGLDV